MSRLFNPGYSAPVSTISAPQPPPAPDDTPPGGRALINGLDLLPTSAAPPPLANSVMVPTVSNGGIISTNTTLLSFPNSRYDH